MIRRALLLLYCLTTLTAVAQQTPDDQGQSMPGMQMPAMRSENGETAAQFASGTAWEPLSTPEHMWMAAWRSWRFMAHGNIFLTYDQQGGPRGAGKAESQNWVMLMERRRIGKSTLTLRQMLSAEPLTTPHPGFPELFQTGETYHGLPLVDHQHPHDVFSEISALVQVPVTERITWLIYGAASGEPALGPVGFPHRLSAQELPAAPLSHHVQDSTHISYGVITTGFEFARLKVEGSAFNGREPDEHRYNFDFGPLDSFSGRISIAPSRDWAMQYSYGHLVHPETLEPGNVNRQTASITYNRVLRNGDWATTAIWGRNQKSLVQHPQNSYLLESVLNFERSNYLTTRLELVDKDELFPDDPAHPSFRIGAYTFGGARDLVQNRFGQLALGAAITFYSKPVALNPMYGSNPLSLQIYLRLRPPLLAH